MFDFTPFFESSSFCTFSRIVLLLQLYFIFDFFLALAIFRRFPGFVFAYQRVVQRFLARIGIHVNFPLGGGVLMDFPYFGRVRTEYVYLNDTRSDDEDEFATDEGRFYSNDDEEEQEQP
jgi:hypothetical protein